MRNSVVGRANLVVAIAVLSAGGVACRRPNLVNVQYIPSGPPAPVLQGAVALEIFDRRPPDRGGFDQQRVGWVIGRFGIPKPVRAGPDAVTRNVWAATADALRYVGIGASAGPNRLLATVLEFWEDGIGGTGSHVVVRYLLVDASGRERWNATIGSGAGEPGDPPPPSPAVAARDPGDPALNMFTYALDELATRARAAFATPAFQQAIAP